MLLFLLFFIAYAIGSFPTGLLIAYRYKVDITAEGSGNIGATNIARVIGKKAGIITLIMDAFKGAIATIISPWLISFWLVPVSNIDIGLLVLGARDCIYIAGLAAVLGHCYSWPGLKGGKGVATSLGVLLALDPLLALIAAGVFVIVFFLMKIVSLASIVTAVTMPLVAIGLGNGCRDQISSGGVQVLALVFISLVVIARHKSNVIRLLNNTEPKFIRNKKSQ
jgi:glycerol-3-phosphate acyltransferase PlsY